MKLPPIPTDALAGPPPAPSPAGVLAAFVIPAHGQPGLLAEAVLSALQQDAAPPAAVVVVDDGCPFPETSRTALELAAAHPGRVFTVRRPNGGLSAARNTGIDFALAAFPACRAVHFLDSDNRLHRHFLARSCAALAAAAPDIGWIYPDIDEFGGDQDWSSAGGFSLLQLLTANYCDAGSLVRRELLDTGLRFDERMRSGFEDWDFWLSAAARGWRGQHLPGAGFRYRRRPESMLSASERMRPMLLGELHRKHAALLRPRRLLALEAAEAPRFAVYCPDQGGVRLALDPATGGETLTPKAARARMAEAAEHPEAAFYPETLCFTDSGTLALLGRGGVLHMVFWWAERLLREAEVVALRILPGKQPALALDRPGTAAAEVEQAPMLLARRAAVWAAAGQGGTGSVDGLRSPDAPARTALLRLTLPMAGEARTAPPAEALLRLEVRTLAAARQDRSALPAGWKRDYRPPRGRMAAAAYAAIGLGPVLPRLPVPGRREIGFLLPLFAFAGLEKVVLNQAAVLRQRGWRTHLFVLGAGRIDRGAEFAAAFDSVLLMQGLGEDAIAWEGGYFGGGVSRFTGPAAAEVMGALAGLDVVVNVHSLAGQALMAPLRRLGIRIFGGLHLVEQGPLGQPQGTPHVQAAYEHAYDGIMVISDRLRDWCLGAGIPAGKLHLIRNAPGYPTRPATVAAALAARARRHGGPLRALFLGRLDRQKGLDRLGAIIAATAAAPVQWRVVGRAVLADAAPPVLGVPIEPPVFQPQELDALYAWADVLVVPSRFEGVPLVVLEAQRMGCVVLATEVGAVDEVVRHGEDGFLIRHDRPEAAIIGDFVATLSRLAADRGFCRTVGAAAAARLAGADWARAMAGFLDHLDRLCPPASSLPPLALAGPTP